MIKGVWGIILLLIIAIPVGFLLGWLTRDESGKARKLYSLICGFSFLSVIVWPFFGMEKDYASVIMLSLFFTGIVFFIMVLRSLNKKVEKVEEKERKVIKVK